jgi:hypothetical protein
MMTAMELEPVPVARSPAPGPPPADLWQLIRALEQARRLAEQGEPWGALLDRLSCSGHSEVADRLPRQGT